MHSKTVQRALLLIVILTASVVPKNAAAQIKFESPGAAATEALQREILCRDIQRAGGQCPDRSVPIAEVRAYYKRLVDANWAAFRAEQQRLIEQAQLEQRLTNAITAALRLQEDQFRQMLGSVQQDLADLRQELSARGLLEKRTPLVELESVPQVSPVNSTSRRGRAYTFGLLHSGFGPMHASVIVAALTGKTSTSTSEEWNVDHYHEGFNSFCRGTLTIDRMRQQISFKSQNASERWDLPLSRVVGATPLERFGAFTLQVMTD